MIKYIEEKLEKLKKHIEIGVLISIILGTATVSIYIYKFCLLYIIGVPFQVSRYIIDIQNTDLLIGIVYAGIYVFIIYLYYLSFGDIMKLAFISTIIYLLISFVLKLYLYEIIWLILLIQMVIFFFFCCLKNYWEIMREGNKEEEEETEEQEGRKNKFQEYIDAIINILNEKLVNFVNKKMNKGNKKLIIKRMEVLKDIFVIISIIVILIIPVFLLAFFASSYPSKKMVINDKILLYAGNDKLLVADYKIKEAMILYDPNSLELIQQEEIKVKFTDRVLGIRKEEESMAIKGAKTIQEYQIMKFIEENFEEESVYWRIVDDNTFEVKDKTGNILTMTMDEIKKR